LVNGFPRSNPGNTLLFSDEAEKILLRFFFFAQKDPRGLDDQKSTLYPAIYRLADSLSPAPSLYLTPQLQIVLQSYYSR
jgi:hypothetical protein